jgi:hypothetical protein
VAVISKVKTTQVQNFIDCPPVGIGERACEVRSERYANPDPKVRPEAGRPQEAIWTMEMLKKGKVLNRRGEVRKTEMLLVVSRLQKSILHRHQKFHNETMLKQCAILSCW